MSLADVITMPQFLTRRSEEPKSPALIDVTPNAVREETLDDIAHDYRNAMAAEVQAEQLLKFRKEARIAAQEKWRKAKAERGLE